MGIRSRIKNRLKIVLGGGEERPASRYSTTATGTGVPSEGEPKPPIERTPPPPPMTAEEAKAQIEADVAAHPVIIYMKGTAQAPMCGFSAAVADIFGQLGVPFETRNVLAEPAVRQAIKDYTDWPTIPQVFVGHEFIGGCDIVREMHESGELKTQVEAALQAG